MSFLQTTIPFDQCDSDSKTVDSTGAFMSDIFTALSRSTCREIVIQNVSGGANLLIGNTVASAVYPILPGVEFAISPKDLGKVALKSAGADLTVAVFMII